MAAAERFAIVGPAGAVDLHGKQLPSPEVVVGFAITLATRSPEPGTWEVAEYDDTLYRVHRLDSDKLDVRVEVLA